MTIYLTRHGKSDKSLQDVLPHDEFELKRALVEGEREKASQLGAILKAQHDSASGYDFVFSGKTRSRETVLAVALGMGFSIDDASAHLREDFGLCYLADKEYWKDCEAAVKNNEVGSHADFFLANPPQKYFEQKNITNHGLTFSAEYLQSNLRSVIRRAIERNTFLGNDVVVMVSHEPVISLAMSNLIEKSVTELGGSCKELEYATFTIGTRNTQNTPQVVLSYRDNECDVSTKIFTN